MKRQRLICALSAVVFALFSTDALADDNCVSNKQPDGSTWKMCTSDNGTVTCYSCPADGSACTKLDKC